MELATSGFNKRASQRNIFTRSKHFTLEPIAEWLTVTEEAEFLSFAQWQSVDGGIGCCEL